MSISLPQIRITFKQLVASFIERSERGNVILIVRDDTSIFSTKVYEKQEDLDKDKDLYTDFNYSYISDTFHGKANKVTVVRIGTTDDMSSAFTVIKGLEVGWIGIIESTFNQADQNSLVNFVKAQRDIFKNFKCAVYNPTMPPNNKGIVVLSNPKGEFTDSRGLQDGDKIIPTLIGYLAGANVTRSVTNITLSNLKSVTIGSTPSNLAATNVGSSAVTLTWQDDGTSVDGLINSGQLVLINKDGVVKVGVGINSLTDPPDGSKDPNAENDEKYIEIVEAEDMIQDDISKAFDVGYQGSTKNKLDNQMLFVNEVNQYFDGLESIDVLDNQYNNIADIDIDTQKEALNKSGVDVSKMTDAQVKQYTYKRDLFLKGDIKILFAMANLNFGITMHN